MMKYARPWTVVVAFSALVALGEPVQGATCNGVNFAESAKLGGDELVLNGLGLRKATMFSVRVYVAGLYLPQKSSDPNQIMGSTRPWRMEMRFVRDVSASEMRDAWQDGFTKSVPDKLGTLQSRIDALKAAMT